MSRAKFRDKQLQALNSQGVQTNKIEAEEVSLFDDKNPHALVNIVPKELKDYIKKIPLDYFELPEKEFKKLYPPTEVEGRLKLRFWDEWQASMRLGHKMRLYAIYYGVCPKEYFFSKIVSCPEKLAWVITPPTEYQITLREVLYSGIDRIREIVETPFIEEIPMVFKGIPARDPVTNEIIKRKVVNVRIMAEIQKAISFLADRVHGAIVQKMEWQGKSMHLNVNAKAPEVVKDFPTHKMLTPDRRNDMMNEMGMDELEALNAQLSDLQKKLAPFEKYDISKEEVIDAEIDEGSDEGSPL